MRDHGLATQDAERIAAFLDGTLSEDERRELMERLDRDEALYEVFAETVRFREDEEGRSRAGALRREEPTVDAGHQGHRWPWLAAAAFPLVAAGALWLALRGDGLATPRLGEALVADARLEGRLDAGWYEHRWRLYRGPGPVDEPEFRIGVWMVDLEVALRRGETKTAEVLAGRIHGECEGPIERGLTEPLLDLDVRGSLADRLATSAEVDDNLTVYVDEPGGLYGFGKWAEAGRLAARSGNGELLRSRGFRRMGRRLSEAHRSGQVAAPLRSIVESLRSSEEELDYAVLEAAFTAIINAA